MHPALIAGALTGIALLVGAAVAVLLSVSDSSAVVPGTIWLAALGGVIVLLLALERSERE